MPEPIDQVKNHAWPNFEWEKKPDCCELLTGAVEEGWIFVSNFTSKTSNTFYMMPVDADGRYARTDGIAINNCPWCGTAIVGTKKYEASQA